MENRNKFFLVADDHSLIRQGVLFILEDLGLHANIFQASTLSQILDVVEKEKIDFAIIDAHFPDGNSINILPTIKKTNPNIKTLIFSGIDEAANAIKFINAGADGFLSKMSEEEDTQKALLQFVERGEYLSLETQKLMIDSIKNPQVINPLKNLTDREMEIAQLYAQGIGNLEISNILNLKQNTVSTVKKRIFEKLNVENVIELAEFIKTYQN